MTRTAIIACPDPRGAEWRLGPLPPVEGRMTLIGWRQGPEYVGGGVSESVTRVLARALTSVARVTFPSSTVDPVATSAWSASGGDFTRVLVQQGFGGRLVARLRGTPSEVALISTRRPGSVRALFKEAGFPWWLQGQVALLSEPDAPPPDIAADALLALIDDDWASRVVALAGESVVGVVRPGVDGDVAGVLSLTPPFEQSLLAALEREAVEAGFSWATLGEEEFGRQLASKDA